MISWEQPPDGIKDGRGFGELWRAPLLKLGFQGTRIENRGSKSGESSKHLSKYRNGWSIISRLS